MREIGGHDHGRSSARRACARRLLIQFKSTSNKGASGRGRLLRCLWLCLASLVAVIFNFGAARKIDGMNDVRWGESDS